MFLANSSWFEILNEANWVRCLKIASVVAAVASCEKKSFGAFCTAEYNGCCVVHFLLLSIESNLHNSFLCVLIQATKTVIRAKKKTVKFPQQGKKKKNSKICSSPPLFFVSSWSTSILKNKILFNFFIKYNYV